MTHDHGMTPAPMIISPQAADGGGQAIRGTTLVIADWPAEGTEREVAPLHVHHADDEGWHVVSGAMRFRFKDREFIARAGSTVLVPAGVPHTFGNAGPQPGCRVAPGGAGWRRVARGAERRPVRPMAGLMGVSCPDVRFHRHGNDRFR
jgi:mannose-6-phosphate isomerase-like protein (cupin superfamily)